MINYTKFQIEFFGHKNIRANHKNTIEITKESNLTTRGDCIIGVGATHACSDIPNIMKEMLRNPNSKAIFTFQVEKYKFVVTGNGNENLSLTHKDDIVIRKSTFVCPRTISIKCNKASNHIPREMIERLQEPTTKGLLTIIVESSNFTEKREKY